MSYSYNKKNISQETEALAADYLKNQGFSLLHRNFRCRLGEIDLN
jgi:putative endonuclease